MLFFISADGQARIIAVQEGDEATAATITALVRRSNAVEALWLASAREEVATAADVDIAR